MRNKIAKIKEWFSIIFIFLIVYGVLLGVCFWIDFSYKQTEVIDHYKKIEIISSRNDEHISGSDGLSFITIDTQEYVRFWIQQGNEFIPNKVPISRCSFFETTKENEVPYVEIGVNKKGEWKFDYKFYIPKGTISRSYNLD